MGHLENDLDYGLKVLAAEMATASTALDWLAKEVHANAQRKGFYADRDKVLDALYREAPDTPTDASTSGQIDNYKAFGDVLAWFYSTVEQAQIARIHSELSEWLEAVRNDKDGKRALDKHCPEFLSAEIEAADVIIRVLDTCNYRGYRIGKAVIEKMKYNAGRSYKHSKNS